MTQSFLLVALGGALGSVLRYGLSAFMATGGGLYGVFPVGTLFVNCVGCIAAGILASWGERSGLLTADLRQLLFSGFLGGFTPFSAFGLETVLLLRGGEFWLASIYVLASVVGGVAALYVAYSASSW